MTSSARFLADCTRFGGSTDNWRSRAAKAVGGPLLAILLAAFGAATADAAPDRVIGLLSLPEVFGRAPCDRFTPQEVVLYSAPDGRRTGSIRVDRNWTFNPEGGCEGLEVRVHADADGGAAILPTKEFEYEAPAAVVLEQRRTWFRIRTDTGSAWLVATSRDEFFPLRHLLTDRLTYLTGEWDGRLASSAGGTPRPVSAERDPDGLHDVRIVGFEDRGDDLWIDVEVLSASACTSNDPRVVAKGWLRAHAASGEPVVWFFARGC